MPGMLQGKVLRSPHAHAKIKSIDTSKAEALDGVKAVITAHDMPVADPKPVAAGEAMINMRDLSDNVIARHKVLYEGQTVAAVAAKTTEIAEKALALIEVDYEVLPHVIDVLEAMKEDAPLLHDDMFTGGIKPKPEKPSNVANRVEFSLGDAEAGFADADVVIEKNFTTAPVHQGYIEPHAVVADANPDGKVDIWCSSQGHFMVRTFISGLLKIDMSKIKVTAAEIGGGFGGKTTVYLEPLAVMLSGKASRPVRMVMNREEVFRASGPTSGAALTVKMGATNDGRIVAGDATLYFQAGAWPGSPVGPAAMTAFAPYDIANVKVVGYDVVSNRQKVVAYRAPGAPISEYGVESIVDEIAAKLGIDPLEFRAKKRSKGRHTGSLWGQVRRNRDVRNRRSGARHRALQDTFGTEPGPRCGQWFLVQHWWRILCRNSYQ